MRKRFAAKSLVAATAALVVTAALAQDRGEGSAFVRFLEGMLSTPERQVSLRGVAGIFSASPSIERITISDQGGAWLEIDGVEVEWTRAALLSRTIDIDSLSARRIEVLRKPAATEAAEDKGGDFSGLPVNVSLDSFAFPDIVLAPPVAGAEAHLTTAGSAQVTAEALAARLSVDRQDRAGTLTADLRLEPQANALTADLKLDEPPGGLLAELLNLRGRPAMSVALSGEGPLDDWRATLGIEADGARVLTGDATISRAAEGHRLLVNADAALESVTPADYAGLLAGESRLTLDVTRHNDGGVAVRSATLVSGGVDLAASGRLTADMVPQNAELSLRVGQAGRAALPFAPGNASVTSLSVEAGLDTGANAPWTVSVAADGYESEQGRIDTLRLDARGQASRLASPADRSTSFTFEANAGGVTLADAALRDAVGPTLQATGAGSWSAGAPIAFDRLQAVLTGGTASFTGMADGERLTGNFEASLTDLSRLAGLAGRPLGGGADIKASGTAGFAGALDLELQGVATDLALGVPTLDPLLAGATQIEGGVTRAADRIAFESFKVTNEHATAELNGGVADALDLTVSASVADLSALTPRASGVAQLFASLKGTRTAPEVEAEISGESVVLMDRPLANAKASFAGTIAGPQTAGDLRLSGSLAGAPVNGAGRLAAGDDGARRIEGLALSVGESRVAGDLTLTRDSLITGAINVVSPDLSEVAPLFLVEASGMVRADIVLEAADGSQSALVKGAATDVVYENITLDSADIDAGGRNLLAAPEIAGTFALRNLKAGGLVVTAAQGRAERQGDATLFNVDAQLTDGRTVFAGSLQPQAAGLDIVAREFNYSRRGTALSLAAPSVIRVGDGSAFFESLRLNAGGGTAILSGEVGQSLDLDVELSNLPAALANTLQPSLGAEGSISGQVFVSGTAASPSADFSITVSNASVAASRNAGLGPLAVATQGTFAKGTVRIANRISGAGGLAVQAAGTIGAAAAAPLDLKITGGVPLALGNQQLASRGAALEGALDLDITVSGTASAPRFSGRVTSEGGGFVDPETGIVLRNLSLAASIANNRLVIDRLNALSGEGTVSASGSVGIDPNSGFPVDLRMQVRRARYVDGTMVAARFDADLALTGSIAAGPALEGSVVLDRTEITVPEQLPRDSVAVDVAHVDPSPAVSETLAAARGPGGGRSASAGGGGAGIVVNLTINAPQRIFVRGRGLDTELGGDLRLSGPISSLATSGAFTMTRGRMDILTQRITFDRGIITFAGDLDPMLDFVGTTQSGDVTITVTVSGRASDPEVFFSSVPELPQDEVLARLIFQKGLGELSPVQVARLAAAASELSGGSGGLLSQLRQSTGLDDLDIVMDEQGAPAVAAGRYVSENVYLGVQQGATAGSSRVTIDLDVTKDIKARAGVSPSGGSSLGIFFEREY